MGKAAWDARPISSSSREQGRNKRERRMKKKPREHRSEPPSVFNIYSPEGLCSSNANEKKKAESERKKDGKKKRKNTKR